jgi:hypothetical protein
VNGGLCCLAINFNILKFEIIHDSVNQIIQSTDMGVYNMHVSLKSVLSKIIKNIDVIGLFLGGAYAIVAEILNFGPISGNLVIAAIGCVAVALLRDRLQADKISTELDTKLQNVQSIHYKPDLIMRSDFHNDIEHIIVNATHELWLLVRYADALQATYQHDIKDRLQNGCHVRILFCSEKVLDHLIFREERPRLSAENIKHAEEDKLKSSYNWRTIAENFNAEHVKGCIEVRDLEYLPSLAIYMSFDGNQGEAFCTIQRFRLHDRPRPCISRFAREQNIEFFDHLKAQYEQYWDAGDIVWKKDRSNWTAKDEVKQTNSQ